MNKIIRRILFAIISFVPLINPVSAFAHTVLIGSNPAVGSNINQLPDSIILKFADPLLVIPGRNINSISVIDPMKLQIASPATVSGSNLSATLNESMKMNGVFKVAYRVVAQDGHVVLGNFEFTMNMATNMPSKKIKIINSGIRNYTVNANGTGKYLVADREGSATGKISIDYANKTLCYSFKVINLNGITGAHIHAMLLQNKVTSVQDEVFVALNAKSVISGKVACVGSDSKSLSSIGDDPSHYFVMIHTAKYPDGAIGGVLTPSN
jgi:methionine-rich copper-binding protein CopC